MIPASSASAYPDSKNHYIILDGLRGIAAVLVVLFHILEPFSGMDHTKQIINHGYLGDLSYPLYIVHYPFIYLFMAWLDRNKVFLDGASPEAHHAVILACSATFVVSIAVAVACFRWWDVPVRRWLTSKLMERPHTPVNPATFPPTCITSRDGFAPPLLCCKSEQTKQTKSNVGM